VDILTGTVTPPHDADGERPAPAESAGAGHR
jgi:hypothetical protein